ncbi:MAG: FAD-dependent oxidoreductase [Clostridia bacterium]|nr:FAD-dependent oxidoreductase [Clostridia bacterium]MDD4680140.1 FAD-dependent oxidoreductase [Clostridia bacterium]
MQSREGFNVPPQSYWMASVPFTQYEPLTGNLDVDVVIVGGGITGITSAFLLKQSGLKVALLEATRILHGTTGHTTAKVTAQHDIIYYTIKSKMDQESAEQYAKANQAAISAIDTIIQQNNIDCDFSWQPAYVYTQDENYILQIQEETELAFGLGFSAAFMEEIPLPVKVKAALRFDNQAQFHPLKYLQALAQQISGNGSYLFENTKALDIQTQNAYTVTTNTGFHVKAPNVIIATHYPFYDGNGMYFSRIYPERSYAVGLTISDQYPGGMYISAEDPGRSYRSQPMDDGRVLIIVGGEHHKTGQSIDTSLHYQNLLNTANSIFQVDEVLYRWSTQDYTTMDQVPYIGPLNSKDPGLYVATGFRKWGMTNGTVAAMILRDYILDKENEWAPVFMPSRFRPGAAAGKFIKENANAAKHLVSSKLSSAEHFEDIEPGEGKVVEIEGEKAGAYRDLQGQLFIVDTTCTHMGCELSWNSAEYSWDCPCHGSRFTYKGKVIEGPAQNPLKKVEIDNSFSRKQ